MKTKKKYWYFIEYTTCPVCGSTDTEKERRYTRRPKLRSNRVKYSEMYDRCMEY